MTTQELNQLNDLLTKLCEEQLRKLANKHGEEIYDYPDEELYQLDDNSRIIEATDILVDAIADMF